MSTRATASGSTATQTPNKPQGMPAAPMMVPHEKVAMRAYQKWVHRGCPPAGTEKQDWLEAEAELKAEMSRGGNVPTAQRR